MAFTIPPGELAFRASRSGGPGGQHVNKAATKVEVLWNVVASPALSDEQRQRLLTRLANRIDKDGNLHVASEQHRSQWRNREAATERLERLVRAAIKPPKRRKKTRPSRAAREKRLQEKRARAEKKRRRGPPRPDD